MIKKFSENDREYSVGTLKEDYYELGAGLNVVARKDNIRAIKLSKNRSRLSEKIVCYILEDDKDTFNTDYSEKIPFNIIEGYFSLK